MIKNKEMYKHTSNSKGLFTKGLSGKQATVFTLCEDSEGQTFYPNPNLPTQSCRLVFQAVWMKERTLSNFLYMFI